MAVLVFKYWRLRNLYSYSTSNKFGVTIESIRFWKEQTSCFGFRWWISPISLLNSGKSLCENLEFGIFWSDYFVGNVDWDHPPNIVRLECQKNDRLNLTYNFDYHNLIWNCQVPILSSSFDGRKTSEMKESILFHIIGIRKTF